LFWPKYSYPKQITAGTINQCKLGYSPQADELAAHLLKMGFAKWQVPDRYEWIASIPRTSTGKFYKLKLREMFPK